MHLMVSEVRESLKFVTLKLYVDFTLGNSRDHSCA